MMNSSNVVVYSSLCLIILIILLCITVRQKNNNYKKKKRYNRGIILLSILCVLCVVFLISGGLSYTTKDKEDKVTDKLHEPAISTLAPNVIKKDKCELIVGNGATPIDCDCSKLSKTDCLNVFSSCPSEKELASDLTLNKCKQCRWSLTNNVCESIPDKYKIRATLG